MLGGYIACDSWYSSWFSLLRHVAGDYSLVHLSKVQAVTTVSRSAVGR